MQKKLIIDSSTLISLERGGLIDFLDKLNYDIVIPASVKEEIGNICNNCEKLTVMELSGKTLKISRNLQELNIGKGEADCIALANNCGLNFIVCDDRKLLRQIFFSRNRFLTNIKIIGFSFLLHVLFKNKLIDDVWRHFKIIINKCNWKRSEVEIANYVFLKEIGY